MDRVLLLINWLLVKFDWLLKLIQLCEGAAAGGGLLYGLKEPWVGVVHVKSNFGGRTAEKILA